MPNKISNLPPPEDQAAWQRSEDVANLCAATARLLDVFKTREFIGTLDVEYTQKILEQLDRAAQDGNMPAYLEACHTIGSILQMAACLLKAQL